MGSSRQQTLNPLDYLLGKGMLGTMKCNNAELCPAVSVSHTNSVMFTERDCKV